MRKAGSGQSAPRGSGRSAVAPLAPRNYSPGVLDVARKVRLFGNGRIFEVKISQNFGHGQRQPFVKWKNSQR
jgi:hypothetical protein